MRDPHAREGRDADTGLAEAGGALYAAVAKRLGPFVTACVVARTQDAFGAADPVQLAAAEAAGAAASTELLPQLRALLSADVDTQTTTPLSLLRRAVAHATRALADLGVPAVRRDRFLEERFPDDPYDLVPASMGVLGPDVDELALAWGAAKARAHRRRHAGGSRF